MEGFEKISRIVELIENDKFEIALKWADSDLVKERLENNGICYKFFAKHFGSRVIQHFIDVINDKEEIGNCPAMIVLLKFFKDKNISLNDLFIICTGLKNSLFNYLLEKNFISTGVIKELERIADLNFEGVMIEYSDTLENNEKNDKIFKNDVKIVKEQVLKLYTGELNEDSLEELKELEEDINNSAVLISFGKADQDTVKTVSGSLTKYGEILTSNGLFRNLGENILKLADSLILYKEFVNDEKKRDPMTVVIESFANDLSFWRSSLFEQGIDSPNKMDSSIISSIDTIISIISNSEEDSSQELELF